jgi:predicted ABC-type transport system involved in lysophospholipase L1 biosynthesis ATPase subunit
VVPEPAIVIEELVKDYQSLRPLRLRRLAIEQGDRVALGGLDATAAEVLVNIVNGAILPDQGEVRVFGKPTCDIANEDEWFASLDRFGIVTARAVLLEGATVQQNLALPFTIDLECLTQEIRSRTGVLAEEVGLAPLLEHRIERLGPADRMRVHLARALAPGPEILLLEHPTAPIPREEATAFAEIVRRVVHARTLTVLAITEDRTFADVVARCHYRLQPGTGALVNAGGWRRWLS